MKGLILMNAMTIALMLTVISFICFFFGFRDLAFKSPENKNRVSGIAFIGVAATLAFTAVLMTRMG